MIFFVLPQAFPPCIGQEEETRTQQAFAALMAISYIVVIVESRSSLELRYLKNHLEDETVSSRENELRSFSLGIVLGETSWALRRFTNISSSNVTYVRHVTFHVTCLSVSVVVINCHMKFYCFLHIIGSLLFWHPCLLSIYLLFIVQ